MKFQNTVLGSLLALSMGMTACSNPGHQTASSASDIPGTFVIEGVVEPVDGAIPPEGSLIWLVPFYGPHPRPVDSCFLSSDGHFRFEGNNELMAIIRLGMMQRDGYQDLLVCTEPGHVEVRIGKESSGKGSPKNDALQQWKEQAEAYQSNISNYTKMYKLGGIDSVTFKTETQRLGEQAGTFVYDFLSKQDSNPMSRFLNQMRFGKLSEERKAELNARLKDTTDYSKPQPGFHR